MAVQHCAVLFASYFIIATSWGIRSVRFRTLEKIDSNMWKISYTKTKMMKVSVVLYSYLREKLPAEARGQTVLELEDGARIGEVIERLDLPELVVFAVNNQIEREKSRGLKDGDVLSFFRAGAGG